MARWYLEEIKRGETYYDKIGKKDYTLLRLLGWNNTKEIREVCKEFYKKNPEKYKEYMGKGKVENKSRYRLAYVFGEELIDYVEDYVRKESENNETNSM